MGTGLYEHIGVDPDDPRQKQADEDAREYANLIDALVSLRKQGGLSQSDVAQRMGTTQSVVSDLERIGGNPRISTIQRYARAVGWRLRFGVLTSKHSAEGVGEVAAR
ncbi:transcriptional regulator with XRE-family HTH domain [Nocardiopsis mwathae]|uniref:Transcriptional regulator with XRE-family HTH domain n=1 Tax=Nocardiopsis mwathae TaxID=1472723 RepID=A0A7X0D4U0_9ACTN|nr:helix-turn-helix transcriptional regulator [Nocardiopsis mwathae]MBB6171543.1 transcriptional regulator with XRE-family HTH domain [Nocardiopsis mwathae]